MEETNVSNNLAPETPVPPAKAVLPWRKALPIYIALWCEAFNSSSIFSYVGYMILDFGMSKSENDSSYMYVHASFSIALPLAPGPSIPLYLDGHPL